MLGLQWKSRPQELDQPAFRHMCFRCFLGGNGSPKWKREIPWLVKYYRYNLAPDQIRKKHGCGGSWGNLVDIYLKVG